MYPLRLASLIAALLLAVPRLLVGCEIATRSQSIGAGTIVYNTAGQGDPVLLLHGLFASKEQWNDLVCRLADAGFKAIAADLPGYGNSDGFRLSAYPLERQARLLQRFTKALRLGRVDIAGSSMGGAIAALYLERYPRQVRSLAFIGSPLGVRPWAAGVRKAIRRGINPFIPIDEQQFDLELRLLFERPPAVPESEKKRLIAGYVERNRHFVQVWNIVNLYGDVLHDKRFAPIPTLILWGAADRVYDVRGAAELRRRFADSELHILAGTGHLLLMEDAVRAGELLVSFLRTRSR